MRKIALPLTLLASIIPVLDTVPAQAVGASRTFVAAQGSDTNPCTFAAPCRSFQAAYNMTNAGGEIDVLDPAGYGALIITGAISIQGHGYAGLAVLSGNGITINAGASDNVSLRGLLIDGVGNGDTGIQFNSGASLNIQDCVIRNFVGTGIFASTPSSLFVSDTVVSDNSYAGVAITYGTAVLTRVQVDNNHIGILAGNGAQPVNVTVTDSAVAGNGLYGIEATSSGPQIYIAVRVSNISNNGTGVTAQTANTIIRLAQSTITGNQTGWSVAGSGSVGSTADNLIDNNPAGNGPPPTLAYK